jgi:hypothetical protein
LANRFVPELAATGPLSVGWRFVDGYELLAEAQALQNAFFDLDGKTRRAVALDDLVMAVSLEVVEHPEDCSCNLCRALEPVLGMKRLRAALGQRT